VNVKDKGRNKAGFKEDDADEVQIEQDYTQRDQTERPEIIDDSSDVNLGEN